MHVCTYWPGHHDHPLPLSQYLASITATAPLAALTARAMSPLLAYLYHHSSHT